MKDIYNDRHKEKGSDRVIIVNDKLIKMKSNFHFGLGEWLPRCARIVPLPTPIRGVAIK